MKKITFLIIIILIVLSSMFFGIKKIGFTAIVDHPALEAIREGVIDELKNLGLKEGIDFEYVFQSAQGNMNTAVAIAKQFGEMGLDIIVPITTPSAQACANAIKDKPIIFVAVTDPVGASLIPSLGKNEGMIAGISDMTPVTSQLKLAKMIIPNAKKIGIIYNPGETNSVVQRNLAKKACEVLDMQLIEITGTTTPEILSAFNSVISELDAVYIGTDNTTASCIDAVGNIAINNKVPVISGDIDIARGGGTIGFGFNYYLTGREGGKLVYDVIKGTRPNEIESRLVDKDSLNLYVNLDRAAQMGIEIPDALVLKATFVVKDGMETEKE